MSRTTWMALVVFITLLVGAVWALNRKPEAGITRLSLGGLQTSTVDRIVITGPKAIELQKKADRWQLTNGREADADVVKNLLSSVTRMNSSDVIAEDPNRMSEYELDSTTGNVVKLYAGQDLASEFTVGKSLPGGLAVAQHGAAFKVSNISPLVFARAPNEWLQRRLFNDALDDVARVNVHLSGQQPYTILHKDAGWELAEQTKTDQTPSDFRFDASAGQALASALINLRVDEILDSDPGADTTQLKPDQVDTLTYFLKEKPGTAPGTPLSHTVWLGAKKEDKGVYAKVQDGNDVYLLAPYVAGNLRKSLTDLRDLTLLGAIDVGKVNRLTINDGKSKLTFAKEGDTWALAKGVKTPAGFELDSQKVQGRVMSVVHARAQAMAKNQLPKATGLLAPKTSVTLSIDGKQDFTVAFGGDTDEQPNCIYARAPDGRIYLIANYLRDALIRGLESFKKVAQADPLTQLDPKALQGLPPDVRASLTQQIAQKKREQDMLKSFQQQQGKPANP